MYLKGHLAKDCQRLELREGDGEGIEGVSSTADFLLMDNSEDEEGGRKSGFNDIRMIFDDDTEEEGEEGEEGTSSKSFDEELGNQPEDSICENNPNMQRYALLSIMHILWLSELTIYETLQLNLPCYQGFERGQSDTFGE